MSERSDAYQEVTDRVLAALEAGTVPWRRPWTRAGRPRSMSTGKAYKGMKVMLFGMSGHVSAWFGTYRQIQELGGQVRCGEKSIMVMLWKELSVTRPDEITGEPTAHRVPMLRTFRVFNATQADNLPSVYYPAPNADAEPIAAPQAVLDAYLCSGHAVSLSHDVHGRAYYMPGADEIHVPAMAEDRNAESYYSTAFHEVTHSTGHVSRLARAGLMDQAAFGCETYGKEELIAEMGAAMLCAETGIDTDSLTANSASYLQSWITAIKGDRKLIIAAAGGAQKAADLILSPRASAEAPIELAA